ncbi:MAG: ubiquinol oxidase subunit II [Paracoccus denitrificans]|nr:MAG: ubiquinol oxidase subunit II [Paracoccus denitrificans]PZO84422.1 MAG: ubiquinol oxidase subunit II [Paracoccus denitrificans]
MIGKHRWISTASLIITAVMLSGCKAVVLSPAGDIAERQKDTLVLSTLMMLIIIIPVMVLVALFAWRYRAANQNARYRPDWDHSTKLELVIWAMPVLIIVALGALTWVSTHLLDPWRPLDQIKRGEPVPANTQPLRVEVVAMDWKWLFIYPDQGVAMINEMAAPVDRPIEFSLTSSTVMNSFYIPAMAGMIYAMPGMETKLHGVFNHPGEYQGLSSNYSGHGFSGMRFKAHAVDQAGFDQWVENVRQSSSVLGRAEYMELAKPTENVAPTPFGQVDPQLFARAVNMCVEEDRMCMAEMMEIDRKGGSEHAASTHLAALTGSQMQTRNARSPVLGWQPFQVTAICTPEDTALMLARRPSAEPSRQVDLGPIRGHGLNQPKGIFAMPKPPTLTQLSPAAADGQDI